MAHRLYLPASDLEDTPDGISKSDARGRSEYDSHGLDISSGDNEQRSYHLQYPFHPQGRNSLTHQDLDSVSLPHVLYNEINNLTHTQSL